MNKQEEILTILQEECAEIIQAVSKIKRFGNTASNKKELERELGDLFCMIKIMHEENMVNVETLFSQAESKLKKLNKYSTHLKSDNND